MVRLMGGGILLLALFGLGKLRLASRERLCRTLQQRYVRDHAAEGNSQRVVLGRASSPTGVLHDKRFYDLKHGGSQKALAAAVAWRDAVSAKVGAMTFRDFHEQRRSNNRSGVPGVHFLRTTRQPSGFWQAMLKLPNGKRISKTFSIRKFGRRDAFRRAVAARNQMLEKVHHRLYLNNATAKRLALRKQP